MFRRSGVATAIWSKVLSKFNKKDAPAPGISMEPTLKDGKIKVVQSEKIEEGSGYLFLNEKDADKLAVGEQVQWPSQKEVIEKVYQGAKSTFQSLCDSFTGRRQRQRKLEENINQILMELEEIKKLIHVKEIKKKLDNGGKGQDLKILE